MFDLGCRTLSGLVVRTLIYTPSVQLSWLGQIDAEFPPKFVLFDFLRRKAIPGLVHTHTGGEYDFVQVKNTNRG